MYAHPDSLQTVIENFQQSQRYRDGIWEVLAVREGGRTVRVFSDVHLGAEHRIASKNWKLLHVDYDMLQMYVNL